MNIYHRLDDVQMSAIDRERAKAHMRKCGVDHRFRCRRRGKNALDRRGAGATCSQSGAADSTLQSSSGATVTRLHLQLAQA